MHELRIENVSITQFHSQKQKTTIVFRAWPRLKKWAKKYNKEIIDGLRNQLPLLTIAWEEILRDMNSLFIGYPRWFYLS